MRSYNEFVARAEREACSVGTVVLKDQMEQLDCEAEPLREKMRTSCQVMRQSMEAGLTEGKPTLSGWMCGNGAKLASYPQRGVSLLGETGNKAAARAIAIAEHNAAMGRVVAAPTAGACGVLPAVLFTVGELLGSSDEEALDAFFCAAGVGMVAAERATISGAEGGCQAEIGTAAAMAAAAAVELAGGTPAMSAHGAALALKNLLGLVCDPVGGRVEVPCIKRNAIGALVALTAAEMALAGIESLIPFDEVIDAMASIGRLIPCSLRETAEGGLAATPTGRKLAG
ncbi:MAG: L-serine ammonia-lyase, iron-sulfur-dependent, subunit alpha [Eggerthellaceae bacterium]|nr:L-serine ammonia-lyase, iron-sulfur-dependent, subunit alpha [Eggerthellaceae bacterium]